MNAAQKFKQKKECESCEGQSIKLIHIKDKNNKGVNVSLGKGIVDFSKFKDGIYLLNPNLNFTLETARGKNPLEEQKRNFNFIREIIN